MATLKNRMPKQIADEGRQRISVHDLLPRMYEWILAIDPNCSDTPAADKSGLAFLNTKTNALQVLSLTFPECIEYFQSLKEQFNPHEVLVLIEGGWLCSSNWHITAAGTARKAAEMGRDVGRNHQTGILLSQMSRALRLDTEVIEPLAKRWKKGKISQEELQYCLSNLPARTNQDQRDAIELAYHRAGKPLSLIYGQKHNRQLMDSITKKGAR